MKFDEPHARREAEHAALRARAMIVDWLLEHADRKGVSGTPLRLAADADERLALAVEFVRDELIAWAV
jgi:hypothetical protein